MAFFQPQAFDVSLPLPVVHGTVEKPKPAVSTIRFDTSAMGSFIAGGAAGGVSRVVSHPLDTVRVKLNVGLHKTTTDCVVQTAKADGVRGFFRGLSPPLTCSVLECAVLFQAQTTATKWIADRRNGGLATALDHTLGGAAAGFLASQILTPGDLIKSRLQVSKGDLSPAQCVRNTLADKGLRGLFRGHIATMAVEVPGLGLWFGTFDFSKTMICSNRDAATPSEIFGCSTVSALVYHSAFYPFNVAKAVVQTTPDSQRPKGIFQLLREDVRNGGLRSLYRGFGVHMVRVIPGTAVMFSVHHFLSNMFSSNETSAG
mmetsp:Transcript_32766/g.74855  ORF Transcript_32766/g.74855 Transcript_32766/m.74855 type:complete len:315 (+) Transcript_32766:176-1120(+)